MSQLNNPKPRTNLVVSWLRFVYLNDCYLVDVYTNVIAMTIELYTRKFRIFNKCSIKIKAYNKNEYMFVFVKPAGEHFVNFKLLVKL